MKTFNHGKRQGFQIGWRVADQIALESDVNPELYVASLHALKSLVNAYSLYRSVNMFSVNNVMIGGK